MSLFDIARDDVLDADGALFDPNRNDAWGLVLSAALAPAIWVIALGVATQADIAIPALDLSFVPSALSPFIWPVLLAFVGLAHWFAWQSGETGRRISPWLVGLALLAVAYPFIVIIAQPFEKTWFDIGTLLLAIIVAGHTFAASRWAGLVLMPMVLFVAFMASPSIATLFSVWSPGFAVTMAGVTQMPARR